MDETKRKEKWMKLLIIFAVVVVFAVTALEIAQYILEREREDRIDRIWEELIDEIEKGKRR